MKTIIFYFSGSGNTKLVANEIAKNLEGESLLYEMRAGNEAIPDLNEFDLIGIGFPIHGFNSPWYPYAFIKRHFPKLKKDFFTFETSGEAHPANDFAARKIIHLLKRRGFHCVQNFHYLMPYNMIFRHTDAMAKRLWAYSKALTKYNAIRLNERDFDVIRFPFFRGWHTPFVRIEWPFAKLHGKCFRVDMEKCAHCGLCLKNCPTKNIEYKDGKFVFHARCTLCMACSFHCPKEAIKPGIFNKGWKVTGSYHVEQLIADPTLKMAGNEDKQFTKKILHYQDYYKKADALLQSKNIQLECE